MNRVLWGIGGVTAIVLTLAATAEAGAQAVEVSGNISLGSDYTFRGISQTLEEPVVQGGLDLAGPSGVYVGMWGSSVNFGEEDLAAGPRAQMELDFYGGIAPSISGFDLDLGAVYYAYPGAASSFNYNFYELYAGIGRGFGPVGAGVDVAYSPDFFGSSGTGLWTGVSASAAFEGLPVTFEGMFGRQTIEDNDAWGTPNYTAWSIGAGTDLLGTTLGAMVTGTNLSEAQCFEGTQLCNTRVIFSLTRGL